MKSIIVARILSINRQAIIIYSLEYQIKYYYNIFAADMAEW